MLSRRLRDQGCQVNALKGRFVQQPLVRQYESPRTWRSRERSTPAS